MRRLQSCCCCGSTRTGTLITAVLGILLSIVTIVLIWVFTRKFWFSTFFFSEDFDKWLTEHDVPRIVLTVNLFFTILISILLIVAVQKRRSWLMLPWVVLGIVLAIGLLISVLHTSISYFLDKSLAHQDDHMLIGAIILVGGLLYLCLYLYLWAVVYSHFLDVRDEELRGRYSKAPYRR